MTRTARPLCAFGAWIFVLDCSGNEAGQGGPTSTEPPPATVASVAVAPRNDTLWFIDDTLRLTATAMDKSGTVITGRTVTWSSDNADVISVGSDGLATAKAIGTAQIKATIENVSQTATLLAQRWKSLSAANQACAVTSNGYAYCWKAAGEKPALLTGDIRFDTVAVGSRHACGLTLDHLAYCWGDNAWGALGDGSLTSSPQPVAVRGALAFATITTMIPVGVSGNHTCALTSDGVGYCWGSASQGQLGAGLNISDVLPCGSGALAGSCRPTPVAVAGGYRFRSVSAGSLQTCGVSDTRTLYCWGHAIGIVDSRNQYFAPVEMPTVVLFASVQNKFEHTCGLTATGDAYCWGADLFGKLGYGTTPQPVLIHQVDGGDWIAIDPASQHTCGVRKDHTGYCWGRNQGNSLGDGTTADQYVPSPLLGNNRFEMVSAGSISCGITTKGSIYCWGLGAPMTRLADP